MKDDGDGNQVVWTPNPRVELPYTYLMAWFVMHCPSLMSAPDVAPEDALVPLVQRLEKASWTHGHIVDMRKALRQHVNFEFYRCFLQFANRGYRDMFQDEPSLNKYSLLSLGCFQWLVNIRLGYLVCRLGPVCRIEPYTPSRFA